MGNWRTVHIDGTLDEAQVEAARKACLSDWNKSDAPYHALCFSPRGSLCGINDWPATRMSVIGNCYERDFSVEDIADALRDIVKVAPSLAVKVHCGGDHEDKTCVATIVVANGEVAVGPPEARELPDISQAQMLGNFFRAIQP